MWRLDHPQALLLLLIVPLLIYLLYYRGARGGKISFNFSIWKGDRFAAAPTPRRVLLVITRVLFWIGFCILIVAVDFQESGHFSTNRTRKRDCHKLGKQVGSEKI